MEEMFPRAVIWDSGKEHHHDVVVDHVRGLVVIKCRETGIDTEVLLHDLDFIKQTFRRSERAQVVSWVEIHG